ncbi:MAG: phosphoribosylglycinamide formyltransferase [Bacteroidales bacterium]|nr:phosphoribosylglycinamide formyltransferase [Bacteroidales bacterium]
MKKVVLFASGNGTNVQQIAEYFACRKDIEMSYLFCNKKDAYVLKRAENLGIPFSIINRHSFYDTSEVYAQLQAIQPDLIVLAGFLWLMPTEIVRSFPKKIINIHPALLPKYGGKGMYGHHVHEAVVKNKESVSGISIHYVNEHYDEGDIIFQASCQVLPQDTADDVAAKIHLLEKEHFPKVIDRLLKEQ